jgi:hypothetical protein
MSLINLNSRTIDETLSSESEREGGREEERDATSKVRLFSFYNRSILH